MRRGDLTTVDAANVLRGGVVEFCEEINRTRRYRVSTSRMPFVVAFRSERALRGCHGLEDRAMPCVECGGKMRTRRETVPFDKPIGLSGVRVQTLVAKCPKCGAYEVMIPDLEGNSIALWLARSW